MDFIHCEDVFILLDVPPAAAELKLLHTPHVSTQIFLNQISSVLS